MYDRMQEPFSLKVLGMYLRTDDEKINSYKLLGISFGLYQRYSFLLPLPYDAELENKKYFENEANEWKKAFTDRGKTVEVGGVPLSLARVVRIFHDYYLAVRVEEGQKKRAAQEEMTLEYSLSQVFSPKQKELLHKRLNGKPLSKTEREYFSRRIKKKVIALANEELYRMMRLVRDS